MTADSWELPPIVHVERGDDPCELHWVCDAPALATVRGTCTPSPDSPLGALLARGVLSGIRIDRGEIVARVADSREWDELVPVVHDAVVAELRDGGAQLAGHVDVTTAPVPSREAVQAVVDRAVGAIAAEHGGGVQVVAVEPDVVLRATGACSGCGADTATLERAAAAVHRELPFVGAVVVERPERPSDPAAPLRWSRTRRSRRDRGGDACH